MAKKEKGKSSKKNCKPKKKEPPRLRQPVEKSSRKRSREVVEPVVGVPHYVIPKGIPGAEQLQLIQEHDDREIARMMGIDPF